MKRAAGLSLAAVLVVGAMSLTSCAARTAAPKSPAASIKTWVEATTTADADTSTLEASSGAGVQPEARFTAAELRALTAKVRLMGVGVAGEGKYVIVRFLAPTRLATRWQPGRLYVVDEKTGERFADVPQMPLIGALLAKPNHDGQVGYVMFENPGGRMAPGATVTVVLDTFQQKHVAVK